MEKEFVPYELALEMKGLGFDEPCIAYATIEYKDVVHCGIGFKVHKESDLPTKPFGVPTWQSAFRWFREEYGLEIILRPDAINAPEKKLREYVILSYDKSWILEPIAEPHWWIRKGCLKTPEEAELESLKKLIEIVKNSRL
jgi:hypothetical protein